MSNGLRAARIGAVFGLVFVELNAGQLHPQRAVLIVRIVGAAIFVVAFLRLLGLRRHPAAPTATTETFGFGYWSIAIIEIAALTAGLLIITKQWHVLHEHVAGLQAHAASAERAWVAFVVGIHFLGLAVVWRRPSASLLGVIIAACGVVGLVLADRGSSETAGAIAAGVVPGAVLLLNSLNRGFRAR